MEADHEADGLRAWGGQGTVLLHDSCRVGRSTALLMERCDPGTPLSANRPEAEQDVIVAGLLSRLWEVGTSGPPFRPLHTMCQEWVAEFQQGLEVLPKAASGVDPGLVRAGMDLFLALASHGGREVLLCTDLHAGNVLSAGREPWLVIDPKPFVGDPCYDVLQHLLNCSERLAHDPRTLTRRMADLLDLDADRVRQWLFARCVIEGLDDPMLRTVATKLAPT